MSFSDLPIDIINYIGQNLPTSQILSLCYTNKTLANICNNNSFWNLLLQRDFKVSAQTSDPKKEYVGLVLRKFAKDKVYQANLEFNKSIKEKGPSDLEFDYTYLPNKFYDEVRRESHYDEPITKLLVFDALNLYSYWNRMALAALGVDPSTGGGYIILFYGNPVIYDFTTYLDRRAEKENKSRLQILLEEVQL